MKPSLLLHVCCAPCAIIPVEHFVKEYNVTLYYYNPNIHPYKEYLDRLDSVRRLSDAYNIALVEGPYDIHAFLKTILNHPGEPSRCRDCYWIRLVKLEEMAEQMNIPNVSTTLLYSIYQKHDLLKEMASKFIQKRTFLYEDFRNQFRKGIQIAKERNYYRQSYCGCLFSNYDRYQKKPTR